MPVGHRGRRGDDTKCGETDFGRMIKSFTVFFMLTIAFSCVGSSHHSGSSGDKSKKNKKSSSILRVQGLSEGIAARRTAALSVQGRDRLPGVAGWTDAQSHVVDVDAAQSGGRGVVR